MVEFYRKLFGCKSLYESDLITFLAYDNEHHRIAIANTSGVLKSLNFVQRFVMRFKIFLNRTAFIAKLEESFHNLKTLK